MIQAGHLAPRLASSHHLEQPEPRVARTLADMWNNGLLLFYGSIALVVALDIAVKLAGDGKRKQVPEPQYPSADMAVSTR